MSDEKALLILIFAGLVGLFLYLLNDDLSNQVIRDETDDRDE